MDVTDAMYERYMRDVSRFERITPDKEAELSAIIIHGKSAKKIENAVNELVQANLLLVIHCLKEFSRYLESPGARLSHMDLVAEGNIGLMNAAKNFDACCGKGRDSKQRIRFSTYACKSIKNAMRRALKLSRFIHIPEHHFGYWTKMKELEDRYGDGLSDEILQEELGVGEAKLEMLKQSNETGTSLLEDLNGDREGAGWAETMGDSGSSCPRAETDRNDLREYLVSELSCLPERTQRMLALMYFDSNVTTYSDLARMFGVSKERCRQVCTHGLNVLRQRLSSRSQKVLGSQDGYATRPRQRPSKVDEALHNLLTMPRRTARRVEVLAEVNAA